VRAHTMVAVIAAVLVTGSGLGWAQGWDGGGLWSAQDAANTPLTSWFGDTGLVVIPSADTLPFQGIQAHLSFIDVGDSDWATIWGANVSIYEGFEVGVTGLDENYTGSTSEELLQAKFQIPMGSLFDLGPDAPMVAVGGRDLSEEINRVWYVVLGKDFPVDADGGEGRMFRVSVGFGDAQMEDTPLDGIFGGVELELFDYMRLQVEHDGQNLNAGLRYWWSDWAITDLVLIDDNIGAGFTLNTGF